MATKTECITQSGAYHTLLCFIEGLFADVSKMIITSFHQNARKLTINKINALKKEKVATFTSNNLSDSRFLRL